MLYSFLIRRLRSDSFFFFSRDAHDPSDEDSKTHLYLIGSRPPLVDILLTTSKANVCKMDIIKQLQLAELELDN